MRSTSRKVVGELGHRLLQGEMEMQEGRKRRERSGKESEAEQQKWTRSKAGLGSENLVIEI